MIFIIWDNREPTYDVKHDELEEQYKEQYGLLQELRENQVCHIINSFHYILFI